MHAWSYWIENPTFMLQVPPDFYIPDFDEDEQNPDERVDRKSQSYIEMHG